MRCLPCFQTDMLGHERIYGFLIMGSSKMDTDDMDQMYGREGLDAAEARGIPRVTYCAYANFTSPVSGHPGSFWISSHCLSLSSRHACVGMLAFSFLHGKGIFGDGGYLVAGVRYLHDKIGDDVCQTLNEE